MVYTKLERSFDSEELHKILRSSLKSSQGNRDESIAAIQRIERPPLPKGSTIYEQAKGEMEIERQTKFNGKDSLPLPGQLAPRHQGRGGPTPDAGAAMSHLMVPACSPVIGHRRNSRSVSRSSAESGSSSRSREGSRTRSASRSRQHSKEKSANQTSHKTQKQRGLENFQSKKTNAVHAANRVKNIMGLKASSFKPLGYKDVRN